MSLNKLYGLFFLQYLTDWFLNLANTPIPTGSSYFYFLRMFLRKTELRHGQPSLKNEFNPTVSVKLKCASITGVPRSEQPKTRNKPTAVMLQRQFLVGTQ